MVFKDNFVAVVVCGGRILRELDEAVTLPFGSDYSLKLKNMESRKALVSVSIDGSDVLNGSRIVMSPNSEMTLDGFLDGQNVHNRFRFINKTKEIVEHRGDALDDGIIRIEYRFEKRAAEYTELHYRTPRYYPPRWLSDFVCGDSQPYLRTYGATRSGDLAKGAVEVNTAIANVSLDSMPAADEGITIRGGDANQHFQRGDIGDTESNSHVITIRLRGMTDAGTVIKEAVTVQTRLKCSSCGKTSKSSQKYCDRCGTRLIA